MTRRQLVLINGTWGGMSLTPLHYAKAQGHVFEIDD
eukprot:CAMPEP_0178589492 /NCGR_PEP_ID=MMETSP0697-20121206/27663_1 /TAXON_ID=265572 /ORGANISM="Extubocellulus spinifer, Strain CCMP396" /LENGTH=35 /DNA_ID= /DNA_START= /DNA_END= /DNA_ORIENTATION=